MREASYAGPMMSTRIVVAAGLGLVASSVAEAKDMGGRLGVGFDNEVGTVSALSVRYGLPTGHPAINVVLEGLYGTTPQGAADFVGGRAQYGVVAEDNMNLYVGGGLGGSTSTSSTRLTVDMAAEWSFFGLENLGFLASWGVGLDLGSSGGLSTRTSPGFGVHYYF